MSNWATQILDALGVNKAKVDTAGSLKTTGPTTLSEVGFHALAARNDDGTVIGTPRVRRIQSTEGGRALIAPTNLFWDDTFNATAQNTGKYQWPVTTQSIAQAAGLLTLNNGGITTINTSSAVQSYRLFPLFGNLETRVTFSGGFASATTHVTNNTTEIGLFSATLPGQAAPTDGVFFRWNASNELRGVISFNGTEVQTAAMSKPTDNALHDFQIIIQTDVVLFYIDRILVGVNTLATDAPAQGQPFMMGSQPLTMRQRIGGSAPATATKFTCSNVYVTVVGPDIVRLWEAAKAGMGHMGYQGQNGHASLGSTAQYANSANPTAAIPTGTAAALGTGLGRQFWETATLALGTDGYIQAFQNPAPTVNLTGRNLIVHGVIIDSTIQATLTGGPFGISYSLAYGHTNVNLATAESATAKAPRRIALGKQVVTAAQAVATKVAGSPLVAQFRSPIVIAPGEFVGIVTKHETGGTVATAGTIAHNIIYDAYFE